MKEITIKFETEELYDKFINIIIDSSNQDSKIKVEYDKSNDEIYIKNIVKQINVF